jgi:hypothetical protein
MEALAMKQEQQWLSNRQAARYLGRTPAALTQERYRMAKGGEGMPFVRLPTGRILYSREEIEDYLRNHLVSGGE